MDNYSKNWYVFYTCPRAEKKANKNLILLGYDTFLPVKREYKIWKNRQRKLTEVPLFPSYIFVYTFSNHVDKINKVQGICACITCAGKPVYASSNDIASLKIMQTMDVAPVENQHFVMGDRVRIEDGPLCGYEGILLKVKGKDKFVIHIECANFGAMVDLESSGIKKITKL